MSNTDALPALNVSDRTQSSEGQSSRFNGSQLLMEGNSTDIFRKMTNDSTKSGANDLLPNIGFSNGEAPSAPREFPSAIEMYNNIPANKSSQPTDGGSNKSGSQPNEKHSEGSNGNRAGEQRLAGVQIIEDEEEQPTEMPTNRDKSQDADSKNLPPDQTKPGTTTRPNEKAGEREQQQPRDQNPVDRNSNPLHRERQPQERGDGRRDNSSQPERLHKLPQQQLPSGGREKSSNGTEGGRGERETKDRPGQVSPQELKTQLKLSKNMTV